MATPHVKKSTPVLLADRIEPCIAFWGRLGFEAVTKAPEGDHLAFAILTNGDAEVMYQTRTSVAGDIPTLGATGAVALFVEVDDLAAVKAATASDPPFMGERTTPYGTREIGVRDPAGHYVVLAQFGG